MLVRLGMVQPLLLTPSSHQASPSPCTCPTQPLHQSVGHLDLQAPLHLDHWQLVQDLQHVRLLVHHPDTFPASRAFLISETLSRSSIMRQWPLHILPLPIKRMQNQRLMSTIPQLILTPYSTLSAPSTSTLSMRAGSQS